MAVLTSEAQGTCAALPRDMDGKKAAPGGGGGAGAASGNNPELVDLFNRLADKYSDGTARAAVRNGAVR